jgi:hypothetical protein
MSNDYRLRDDLQRIVDDAKIAPQWDTERDRLAALPADDRVAKLVEAAKAALKWLDDDLGVSSEAQPERQNLRSALSALEAGK